MTPIQEEALRDYLQEAITPLIEQVLVKKLGQAMEFAAKDLIQLKETTKKKEWQDLTDDEMDGLVNRFARYELARAILAAAKEKNT